MTRGDAGDLLEQAFSADPMTRRTLIARGAKGGVALGLAGLVATSGGRIQVGADRSLRTAPFAVNGFTPSSGSQIPNVNVNFAMWPFGDTTMGYIGIKNGYFSDVGISVSPHGGETQLNTQTPGELLTGQLNIASGYMPVQIQTYAHQQNIKMIQFHDLYVGNALLASPTSKAKTYAQLAHGKSFAATAEATVKQMVGKTIGLGNEGNNRDFFNTLLSLGHTSSSNMKLDVLDDSKIVELGKAGEIQFAMPAGASQNVELLDAGFYRIFGVQQLIDFLPKGDPRLVTAIGHAGIVSTESYIASNMETVLRFMSVYWRIIDEVKAKPAATLAVELPNLETAIGSKISLSDSELIFAKFYQLLSFENTPSVLVDKKSSLYIDTVYTPQIAAAEKGGILPKNGNVTPEDIFTGIPLYQTMVSLKKQYDALKKSKTSASGPLVTKAAQQYKNYNFLDAYRLLRAA